MKSQQSTFCFRRQGRSPDFRVANFRSRGHGKLADFVILSDDPTAIDPETLDTLKVMETIKEGETVFALTDAEMK